MRGSRARRREVGGAGTGTAALIAEDGSHPEHECVLGELVWTSELCDDLPCRCEWGSDGAASGGITTIAEVRRVPGVERRTLRGALVAAMVAEGHGEGWAGGRADSILALAAALPDGTLLRLEHGLPLPFPPGSRVVGRGEVVSPGPRNGW